MLVLMLLLVWRLFAGSSQCKVMQTVGRQAGSSCIVCLGLSRLRPKTGQARLGRFIGVPVMQWHCCWGRRKRDNGQMAGPVSLKFSPGFKHIHSKWTGLISRLLKVHHVNKRSFMMRLQNNDNVNRMEGKWVKERTGTAATSIIIPIPFKVTWAILCSVVQNTF